jgi:hypothetical protein
MEKARKWGLLKDFTQERHGDLCTITINQVGEGTLEGEDQ